MTRRKGTAAGTELTQAVRRAGYQRDRDPHGQDDPRRSPAWAATAAPRRCRRRSNRMVGVRDVRMSSRTEAVIYYDRRRVSCAQLVQAVERCGFTAYAQG